MKITKIGHCCLLIEYKGKRILTDPGAYSTGQTEQKDLDLILVTHEHGDHLHIESLKKVLENNNGAKIITNTGVGKILAEEGIEYELLEEGDNTNFEDILLEAYGSEHEEIFEELGQVQNTGYFIDNKLFYPGDAFTNPGKPVAILALPIVAPWTNYKRAMEYALEVSPEIAFPVHDGMIVEGREGPIKSLTSKILEPKGIDFRYIGEGESLEI